MSVGKAPQWARTLTVAALAALAGAVAGRLLLPPGDGPADRGALDVPLPTSTGTVSGAEARSLMDRLSAETLSPRDLPIAEAALGTVLRRGDRRFVAVLIELLRADQLGTAGAASSIPVVDALERLSGETFGGDWFSWVEWYGSTDLEPPPGFIGWKGRLLGRLDPGFAEFLPDGAPVREIRVEQIAWGGVAVDGIPALDRPAAVPATEAAYLTDGDPVFGIGLGGEARAYPLRILDWHEMANDVLGGVPFSLAYCTLCGSGIAYATTASGGTAYTFGSSGLLYESNKLMYDRQTRTLWNQFTGRPVLGELAARDIRLELLPVVVTTWAEWRTQHPDTDVLDIDTGFDRPYGEYAAYADYFASDDTLFPVSGQGGPLPPKTRVYGLDVDGVARAYPVADLAAEGAVNDAIGETPVVLVASRGTITVSAPDRDLVERSYEAGAEVRAYARGTETFRPGREPDLLLDAAGGEWRLTEEALIGPDGRRAPRVQGLLAYWFAWLQFHPVSTVYGLE